MIDRYRIEKEEEWDKFSASTMPFIQFPADWKIQLIAPFGGALQRFRVQLPSGGEKSIYFDAHDVIGYFGAPYWEVYPYQGDVGRCAMDEVEQLLDMIQDESREND
jgi:hypothetical protein